MPQAKTVEWPGATPFYRAFARQKAPHVLQGRSRPLYGFCCEVLMAEVQGSFSNLVPICLSRIQNETLRLSKENKRCLYLDHLIPQSRAGSSMSGSKNHWQSRSTDMRSSL